MSPHPSNPVSSTFTGLSESDVQAFADGALSPAHAANVRQYLSAHPDEAHRVAFYEQLNHEMRSSFEQPATVFSARKIRRLSKSLFAGLIIFALASISMAIFALDTSDAQFDHAAAHALEQIEQAGVAYLPPPAGDLAAAPDLRTVGFEPIEAREIRLGLFSRATEVVYRNRLGETAVLLSIRNWLSRAQPQWQARREGAQRFLAWTTPGTRYVLAGRAETRGLMLAADLMTSHH